MSKYVLRKIVKVGYAHIRDMNIFVSVDLIEKPKGMALHLSFPSSRFPTHPLNTLCQIAPSGMAPGWTQEMIDRLIEVWEKYNDNHLRRECEHMSAMKALGFDVSYGDRCEECGYITGITYYHMPLPDEVIDFIKSLPG